MPRALTVFDKVDLPFIPAPADLLAVDGGTRTALRWRPQARGIGAHDTCDQGMKAPALVACRRALAVRGRQQFGSTENHRTLKILFVRCVNRNPDVVDGGIIADDRLLAQFAHQGVDVEVANVVRKRPGSLPLWASAIDPATLRRVAKARRSGRRIVLSHEGLFRIAHHGPVDALIVHNYFTHFIFRGRPLVERYFRCGSAAFYRKAFAATRSVFFVSHRERMLALKDCPTLSGRSDICTLPPRPTPRFERSDTVLHMSGNEAWMPKRLSRLTKRDLLKLAAADYRISDFDTPVTPGCALINDRFIVGFKLRLAQMLHSRDVIASFCDLQDEVENICPGNPFYRQVATVEEAIAFFQQVAQTHGPDEIDAYYARMEAASFLPSWRDYATRLIELIGNARPG